MAQVGQQIVNPRTGQRMTFAEINDEELRIDSVNPASDEREPVHVHPKQQSGAEVIAGSLVFEVAGERREVGAGEAIAIPAGTPHRFWNEAPDAAHSVQFFRPALDIAAFFETMFVLAARGELAANGMPGILQLALMVPEFGDEIRPARPPWPVLRAASALLAPVARLRGYSARLEA